LRYNFLNRENPHVFKLKQFQNIQSRLSAEPAKQPTVVHPYVVDSATGKPVKVMLI
jgi:hypothetical protein